MMINHQPEKGGHTYLTQPPSGRAVPVRGRELYCKLQVHQGDQVPGRIQLVWGRKKNTYL